MAPIVTTPTPSELHQAARDLASIRVALHAAGLVLADVAFSLAAAAEAEAARRKTARLTITKTRRRRTRKATPRKNAR